MKHLIRAILISLLFSGMAFGEEVSDPDPEGLFLDDSVIQLESTAAPVSAISICNSEGKCANIDFRGDKIVYSGELEVDESAKLFFEYFEYLCLKEEK